MTDHTTEKPVSAPTGRLHPNRVYTFNLAPSDTYQYFSAPKKSLNDFDRERAFYKGMNKLLSELLLHDIDVVATVEITEPMKVDRPVKGARLHLHGLIRFHDYIAIKWFLLYGFTLLCEVGTVDIDTITDFAGRMKYMRKMKYLKWQTLGHVSGYSIFK